MMFQNRLQAGRQLANVLKNQFFDLKNLIILALPRGGVPVGFEVARELKAPLEVIICRKIGAPGNPEFAIGAISEAMGLFLNKQIIDTYGISQDYIDTTIKQERKKIQAYQKEFRQEKFTFTPGALDGKIVIIIDDGAATGMTIKAAIDAVKKLGSRKTIIALPVAPHDTAEKLQKLADQVIILDTPSYFRAVGQFYTDFKQIETNDVKKILLSQKTNQ